MSLICLRCYLCDVAAFDDDDDVGADAFSGVFSFNCVQGKYRLQS